MLSGTSGIVDVIAVASKAVSCSSAVVRLAKCASMKATDPDAGPVFWQKNLSSWGTWPSLHLCW